MYYRYKPKKKNKKKYWIIILLLAISYPIYIGYEYRHYLLFWEYTYNKLQQEVDDVNKIGIKARKKQLIYLNKICNEYKEKNNVSAKAFLLSGKAHFQLGEICLAGTFSHLLIHDSIGEIDQQAITTFIEAIKNLKKGIALDRGNEDVESLILLARACFYTGFYLIPHIYEIIAEIEIPEQLSNKEDIRFCSIVYILSGKDEAGMELLLKHGGVSDALDGLLFKATVNRIAKKYTSSILEYKKVLNKTSDNIVIKLVHINLGKIYYTQSLYKESLFYFLNALKIDQRDNELKIWIGRNYSALGQKNRARAIWGEVLVSDHTNKEAKKLLGLM